MKTILFRGSPGTGKTFYARAAAYYLCHDGLDLEAVFSKDISRDMERIEQFIQSPRCEYIQVHPSMGYEDIVYGPNIRANGAFSLSLAGKRILTLCEHARGSTGLHCVIFDDISRANAGALLGNLLYAMEHRDQPVSLGNGQSLCMPENVVFLFTECTNSHGVPLDYTLRRRMDHVRELLPDAQVLKRYYASDVRALGAQLIVDVYDTICRHIDRTVTPEFKGREREFYPGQGSFIAPKRGTPQFILDTFRQRVLFQVFPYIRELEANGVIAGDACDLFSAVQAMLNTGIAGVDRVRSIQKVLVSSASAVDRFSLEDTKRYYQSQIIPNGCSDYRTMLECLIDAAILNGIFSYDYVLSALLLNPDAAAVPNKVQAGVFASYLVPLEKASEYYYETPGKNGGRVSHAYYSLTTYKENRWGNKQASAYLVDYADQETQQLFLPLNGVRLHTFTVNNVCKANNPAEIYGALYRFVQYYLQLYAQNIALIMGDDPGYKSLYAYITLEIRYLQELHRQLGQITAASPSQREKARIQFFGTKLLEFRTLWNPKDAVIEVDPGIFAALTNGTAPFTAEAFEGMFQPTTVPAQAITLRGVVKMADLHDYQRIMENIGVRQMIFQGPPGTSKTFESKKFVLKQLSPNSDVFSAAFVTQDDITRELAPFQLTGGDYADPLHSPKLATGGWDLVQFHPSYGYEDFIRGIEVTTSQGAPSYNTVNRILGKLADFAKLAENANPECPPKFYLIIDEINRANLASVFGELIYGLEYRDSRVSTPYEVADPVQGTPTKDIVLGKNLFIIGTMNTADKSIDAIDYAIRRRFLFIESPANRDVVITCYQRVSGNEDENSIELFLFDAVQGIFDDDRFFNSDYQKNDVKIGHTYFLRKKADGYLDDIVEHFVFQVIPILKEYVKDGILDPAGELLPLEHTAEEIHSEQSPSARCRMLSENIMIYAKEFGNRSRSGAVIDNGCIGAFLEELADKFGF